MRLFYRTRGSFRRLTTRELLCRMGIIKELDPIIDAAYRRVAEERWRAQYGDSPHGNPWHVSFHASSFPGDDPRACGRRALYTMMDLPSEKPFNRNAMTIMNVGKAVELELVQTLADAGILISARPDDKIQTGFELREAWLTGSVDCVISLPGSNRPIPIEIKTKYQRDIEEMATGQRGPDIAHIHQIKSQLGLISIFQDVIWPGLNPVTHGYIYYLSRDKPEVTAEFRVDLDREFFNKGVEKLQEWKQAFIEERLIEENPGRRSSRFGHPMGWQWSKLPCQWCNFKKACQHDFRQGITDMRESVGISRAKLIREHYDYNIARERVFNRWS